MGNTCVPKSSSNIQYTNKNSQKHMSNKQQQMQTQVLISQLYSIIISEQYQQQHKSQLIVKKLQPHPQAKISAIAQNLKNNLKINQQNIKIEQIRQNIIISSIIVSNTQYHKQYQKISKNLLNQLGLYMQKQQNIHALDSCVKFVDKMFLDHGYTVYSTADGLFKGFIQRFIDFGSDQIRQQATQILIEMMLDNKKLLKLANTPYYFIQFWLYTINQQTQLDRQLYWIESVKKLYSSDKTAEDCLFYDNDFKVFVDLLVRVIYQCPDGKTLRTPLECYLVLSCTKKMHPTMLRLNDIKEYIGQINGETLGVNDLFKEIKTLK